MRASVTAPSISPKSRKAMSYVEGLVTPGAVNTMPEATLRAFADHGDLRHAVSIAGSANAALRGTHAAGIDLDAVTSELEREGVRSFCDSYHALLGCIETKLEATLPGGDGVGAHRIGA